jgi:pyruvate dehydrogenase E1 component alpha subunit
MPRETIELSHQIERLSILDEHGNLDEALEPQLDDALLLRLHRTMLLGRRFDERMLKLQRQGRLGTFAPIKGQEASQLGAVATLRASDWLVPAFRETAAQLWRGQSLESILLTYGGFYQGNHVPEGANALPVAIPVGTQILHGAGIAYAIKLRGKDDVAMTFFGDGATSTGDFYEALNFAGVFKAPVIFVCQNNQWAISVPRANQTAAKTLAQKALAAGIHGIQVDGNDVLSVYVATGEAVARARAGEGPTLIENITYRLSVHTTADDPTIYRDEAEVTEWENREPIRRFQKYLIDKGLLTEDSMAALEDEVQAEIRAAVERTEKQMEELSGAALTMFDHLYAEMPPYLQEQRDELARELEEKEAANG